MWVYNSGNIQNVLTIVSVGIYDFIAANHYHVVLSDYVIVPITNILLTMIYLTMQFVLTYKWRWNHPSIVKTLICR